MIEFIIDLVSYALIALIVLGGLCTCLIFIFRLIGFFGCKRAEEFADEFFDGSRFL